MADDKRLGLKVSGGGSTAVAIVRAAREGRLTGIEPCVFIASKADIGACAEAGKLKIPCEVVDPRQYPNPEAFGEALLRAFDLYRLDAAGQYGWLPLTPANVISKSGRLLINQHPGPIDPWLPGFGGKHMHGIRVHAAVIEFLRLARLGQESIWHTEVTAQLVAERYDEGGVFFRTRVPVYASDTPERLQKRAILFEHAVQIATLQDYANGCLRVLHRDKTFVRRHEEEYLAAAKRYALEQYSEKRRTA